MRTPAGTECPYYYADYFRGRSKEECRLIDRNPQGGKWTPDLCTGCAVPKIVLANACQNLVLEAEVKSGFLRIGRGVKVAARCTRSQEVVEEPEIGCGLCHQPIVGFTLDEGDE
jgi:hypothetical protein